MTEDTAGLLPHFLAEPGAVTAWQGASLLDYSALHTARCFAIGIGIFLFHWALYRYAIHAVRRVRTELHANTCVLTVGANWSMQSNADNRLPIPCRGVFG
jgi:hypothetical protein